MDGQGAVRQLDRCRNSPEVNNTTTDSGLSGLSRIRPDTAPAGTVSGRYPARDSPPSSPSCVPCPDYPALPCPYYTLLPCPVYYSCS